MLGSPIGHSKSPALHAAAYAALGLGWRYEAIEVASGGLAAFIGSLDDSWRGLSLTMPLKREVLPLLAGRDPVVELTGGANTVLFDGGAQGFNTDVFGVMEAFRSAGVSSLESVQILGGGATAASVLVAVAELGAVDVRFALRDPAKGGTLVDLGERIGVDVVVRGFEVQDRSLFVPDAVISTLPGGTQHSLVFAESIRSRSVLFDVAYDPWPSVIAASWLEAGGRVISGLSMLTLQALAQVRVFVNGSPAAPLENEAVVLAAMQSAVAR